MDAVPEGTLNYWEMQAKDMSFSGAIQIARAYGISLDELAQLYVKEFKK